MKLFFHPIDAAAYPAPRRLLAHSAPLVAALSRRVWEASGRSRSTFHQGSLWRTIWYVNRAVGLLPRSVPSYRLARFGRRIRMKLDLSRLNDAFALCYGPGESEVAHAVRLLCPSDGVILDVGANIGSTALAFAEAVPRGHVHAFEPAPDMCAALRANLGLSGIGNVTLHPFGLSDESARGRLAIIMEGNPGSAAFQPDEAHPDLEVRRLDDTVGRELARIDLIKLDVEGWELRVLQGASAVLQAFHPALIIEINPDALQRAGTTPAALGALLQDLGYRSMALDRGELVPYGDSAARHAGIHNLIALHPSNARAQAMLGRSGL